MLRLFRPLLLLLLFGPSGPASALELTGLRLWVADDHTRVVFDLSDEPDYKLFQLDAPPRLVLDFRAGHDAGLSLPTAKGVVQGLRTGRQDGQLRVVLDIDRSVQPRSFLLPPANGKPRRLVLDLYEADGALASVKTVEAIRPALARKVVIAIDAGHGGEDPGAIGAKGSHEKDLTLAVARELARQIDAEPGMSAVLIRDRDFFIPLEQRYAIARKARADLFLSIHADAFANRAARGSSVFVLSNRGASSEAARMLATQENQSDLVGGVSLGDKDSTLAAVLLDLSQSATMEASENVGMNLLRGLARIGNVHKSEVQRANFVVLRSPDVPSVLVETGFITNPSEEQRLHDPEHRRKLAAALVVGVRDYFANTPPPGTLFASNPQRPSQHVVARGESLSLIAGRHQVSVDELRRVNRLAGDNIAVGAVLNLPHHP
ncbi:MAG: N-acetylmuramoyl-L-alanine amidase [Lysobacterales bacterium]